MSAWRAILTIGLATLSLCLVGFWLFARPPTAYTGVRLRSAGAPLRSNIVNVDPGSPGYKAGIRSGDALSCLSNRDFMLLFATQTWGTTTGYAPGTVIHGCVVRNGSVRAVAFVASPRPAHPWAYYNAPLTALRLAEYAAFLLCGIALVLARPCRMTWIFYAFCLAYSPSYSLIIDGTIQTPLLYTVEAGLSFLLVRCGTPLLLLFALLAPDDETPGWRDIARRAAWVLLAGMAALALCVWYLWPSLDSRSMFSKLADALAALTVFVIIARLSTMASSDRARFRWIAFAIIWGVVCDALRLRVATGFGLSDVAGLLTFVMPVVLVYAILRRHVIDVRFVVTRGVVYALVTTLVVGLIGLVDWATSTYLHEARAALALDAIVTIALGFILHRTYRLIEYAVDALLFREKHAGEEYLHRLSRTLPFAESEDTIDRAIVCAPYEKLALTGVALFRTADNGFVPVCAEGWSVAEFPALHHDHALACFFMAERGPISVADLHSEMRARLPQSSAPAFAVPIFARNDLIGFVLYGIHRDGTRLDPDEERVLERLCEAAAQAYTGVELDEYRGGARISPLAVEALPS